MVWGRLTEQVLAGATTAFGESVTFFPDGGEAYTTRGIVDDDHTVVVGEVETTVSTTGPMVSVRASDLAHEVAQDDELEMRGRRWVIVDVQPDGQGTLDLILNDLGAGGQP